MSASQTPSLDRGSVAGLVLAGGRSLRFGGEKAAALLDGRPLLLWAADRLRTTCAAIAVSARPGTQAEALAQADGLPVLHDAPGDADGPLSGIKAGLIWAQGLGARALAVSPCDAPLLPDDLFARLVRGTEQTGAAMAWTLDGRQPLCAVWPVGAVDLVKAALAGGSHPPVWKVLEEAGAARVLFETPEAFANLNTREDLTAAHIALQQPRQFPT
jgi:molybdopterin-guanine dinucleotide biosynthesis protein A